MTEVNNDVEKQSFQADGIMEKGYGFIPKLIMKDKDITIEAKAIYAYLSSYTGAGNTAYPSISLMCGDLDISEARFYKHRKLLVEKGYIVIEKRRTEGGWSNNVYKLPFKPYPQNLSTQNLSTQNLSTQNLSTQNIGTKSNNLKSNSLKSNNVKSTSEESGGGRLTEEMITEIVNQWNKLGLQDLRAVNSNTKRHTSLKARIKEYSYQEVLNAIDKINSSSFLKGQNDRGWTITFDWLVRPNNFLKVIEGNYEDKGGEPNGRTQRRNETSKSINESVPISEEELSQSKYDF